MSDRRAKEVYDAIADVLQSTPEEWQLVDTERLGKLEQMGLLICTWAGFIECRIKAAAWTDSSCAEAVCTVTGLWKYGVKGSILPDEVRSALPAWKGKHVIMQLEPVIETRLMMDGRNARDDMRQSHLGRLYVPTWALTHRQPGKAIVRILSTDNKVPGGSPPPTIDEVIMNGFSELKSAIGELAGSQEAGFDELHDLLNAPQVVSASQAAAAAGISKKSFELHLAKGDLPRPDFPGGGGKASKWFWSNLRPKLELIANRQLPERFPSDRFVD